jgi:hypothetical protein
MCLKLVKQIDSIDRLPINHTIYAHLVQKEGAQLQEEGKSHPVRDASVFLFGEFERVQKEAHMQDNPQKIDPDSGLPFCVFHNDRVEHFYCEAHKVPKVACRYPDAESALKSVTQRLTAAFWTSTTCLTLRNT